MHNRVHFPPVFFSDFAPSAANTLSGKETAQGKTAQGNNELGVHEFDLAFQVLAASSDLLGQGVAVLGRAAFDHICDEHLLAVGANGGQQSLQELPCRADEGPALLVFMITGALPNKHQFGVNRAFSRHCVGPVLRQRAISALFDQTGDLMQTVHTASSSQSWPFHCHPTPLSNVTLSLSTRLKINSAKGLKPLTAFSSFGTQTRFFLKVFRFFAYSSE
jgi:hypothetical protein